MKFMGWVMKTGILGEWVEVILKPLNLLSGLKMSALKILCSVKTGRVSMLIPSIFIINFRMDMESSRWYVCGRWWLLQWWRIFETQKWATIRLTYRLDNVSTSHIIWFGLFREAKGYHRSPFAHRWTMKIHPLYPRKTFTAEQSQSQWNKHPRKNWQLWHIAHRPAATLPVKEWYLLSVSF